MPFIVCWNKVPCTIENAEGKPEASERQCGAVVTCNMRIHIEPASRSTHVWRGTCMYCHATYTDTVTMDSPTLAPTVSEPVLRPVDPSRCTAKSQNGIQCGLPAGHGSTHRTGSIGTRSESWEDSK